MGVAAKPGSLISVVIPVKNGGTKFKSCLDAIRSQVTEDAVEVVVVDSGSTDGTQAFAQASGAIVLEIDPSAFNHGATRNFGARQASGDVVVFTVDDALPTDTEWLARLVAPMRDDDRVAGAYARQIAYDTAPPHQAFYIDYRYGPEPRRQRAEGDEDLTVSNVLFSNVSSAIRRSVLEEFPFASDIVIAEDLEWCARVLLAGWEIEYVPDAVVRHSHEYSLADTVRRYFDQGAAAERSFMAPGRTSPGSVRGEGMSYVRRELAWMWKSGHRAQMPQAVAHEAARFAGYQLGVKNRSIPRRLRTRISRTPVYWSR